MFTPLPLIRAPQLLKCTLALLMCCHLTGLDQDPRPHILIIGDYQSQSHRGHANWTTHLQERHPEWRISVDTHTFRLFGRSQQHERRKRGKVVGHTTHPGLQDTIDEILTTAQRADLIVFFLGHNLLRSENQSVEIADSCRALAEVVQTIRRHKHFSNSDLALVTPLPILNERLDNWSRKQFPDADKRSELLASSLRSQATQANLHLIDAYSWMLHDRDDKQLPARLMDGPGWLLMPWAQAQFADWMRQQLTALQITSSNPEAYAKWKTDHNAQISLAEALAASGEAVVDHGPALAAIAQAPPVDLAGMTEREKKRHQRFGKKPKAQQQFDIPSKALQGQYLNLLLKAQPGKLAVIASANAVFGAEPVLEIQTPTAAHVIKTAAYQTRVIDETRPTQIINNAEYGINAGKWRPFPVLSGLPGKRRWLLLRFPLTEIASHAETIQSATLTMQLPDNLAAMQILKNNAPAAFTRDAEIAAATAHIISGLDSHFACTLATWKSCRTNQPWTGGPANRQQRRDALQELLTKPLPASMQVSIQARLDALQAEP